MASCNEEDEGQFFDAQDDIIALSNSGSEYPLSYVSYPGEDICEWALTSSGLDFWVQNPVSVEERRRNFFNWLELSANKVSDAKVDWGTYCNGSEYRGDSICMENLLCRAGNWENGDCYKDEDKEHGLCGGIREVDTDMPGVILSKEACAAEKASQVKLGGSRKSETRWCWFRKLRSFSCVMEERKMQIECSDSLLGKRPQRVKVQKCSKKHKEMSALYSIQDFQAHDGPIHVMKFSPDGEYLASAGEDRIVRVWKVVVDERSNEIDFPDTDPLSLYFTLNHQLELQPSYTKKEKTSKAKSWSRTSDSACVVIPPKVFRLLEKPLYEFKGHCGEILDLSWSRSNCLLSSSVDKTVRLWQIGYDRCLQVFPHNNYVTCVHFNPVDDDYFISGSLDGKVRIWEISSCHVLTWSDIKGIVTAVSYRPDGQGCVVGSIEGHCRFYTTSANQLRLDGQVCLHSKKKSSGKRIIGFQYFPEDLSKVMVTCADSQVRILHGMNLIVKYKRHRGGGNYLSSSLTANGKYVVSACEDSNVYIWSCADHDHHDPSHVKKIRSCEHFPCTASLAVPWNGFQNVKTCPSVLPSDGTNNAHLLPSPAHFSLDQEFFLESNYPNGSQTWPEENLPPAHPSSFSGMLKSEYKFLRACQSISSPNAWGLIILTADWDGRIRSFHNYGLPVPN